jgi:hypothetical protein
MKNILVILALFAFAFTAQAQDLTIGSTQHFATYVGVAGDTLDASTDLFVNVYVNKDYFYHVNAQIEADSLGTGADIAVKLQGSWDNTTFYDIGSAVTWGVTTADTVFSLNSFTALTETFTVADSVMSTAQLVTYTRNIPGLMYPYIRVAFDGASGADMLLTRVRFRIIKAN